MDHAHPHPERQPARSAGGGFALLLLLALVVSVPASVDRSWLIEEARQAQAAAREGGPIRQASGAMARAVRSLARGATLDVVATWSSGLLSDASANAPAPKPTQPDSRPAGIYQRPDLLNLPPPAPAA